MAFVAVLRQRDAFDQIHDKVGSTAFGGAGVQHFRNIGVVHHGKRLTLSFKAGNHLTAVHSWLNDLQGHATFNRMRLLGHVHDPHAAFADLLEQLVGADLGAGTLARRLVDSGCNWRAWRLEELGSLVVDLQECVEAVEHDAVAPTNLLEILSPRFPGRDFPRHLEDGFFIERFNVHRILPGV